MDEIRRACSTNSASGSRWLQRLADGKFALTGGVTMLLYVSTVPCESVPFSSSPIVHLNPPIKVATRRRAT